MELMKISCFIRKTPLLMEYLKAYFLYDLSVTKQNKIKRGINKIFKLVLTKKEIKEFNKVLSIIKNKLSNDALCAYKYDPSFNSLEEAILSSPGLFAIMAYRVSNYLSDMNIKIIPRLLSEYAHSKTGIDIHPEATIGNNFFIDHGTGIVIGATTIIGDNVKIYHGVTLGARSINELSDRKMKRHPTINCGVTIYSNSTILGGDTVIGEYSIIGAHKLIKESIPSNTTVI